MMATLLALLLVLAGCAKSAPEKAQVDPTSKRSAPAGDVVGYVGQYGSHVWLGIPYAAPPVGERRWHAPEPAPRWSGEREALELASGCPQFPSRFAGLPGDPGTVVGNEDCLYLNVYAPRFAPGEVPQGDARLPVLVWIHGGGNVIGHGGGYDGGYLASRRNVLLVTINYRLGPLGWFRHASLRSDASSPEESSGNFGTLDMVRALTWIRDNISAFGGDPDTVTIFGESAGGRDVLSLLISPQARGLFHRAISQSGGLRRSTAENAEGFSDDPKPGHVNSSNEILMRLLIADGRASNRDQARTVLAGMKPEETAQYLHAKSPAELLAPYHTEAVEGLIDVPNVFSDGTVLPDENSLDTFARPGAHAGVPVMIGTNRDEEKIFLFVNPEHVRMMLWVLPRLRDPERFQAVATHQSDLWKAAGADEPAAALIEGAAPGVFVYRFDWDEEPTILGSDFSQMIGAAHGFEIPFVFGHFDLGPEANRLWTKENEAGRRTLSEQMMSYWVNFAKTGAPGRGVDANLPEWTPAPSFLVLDTPEGGGLRMSDETLREEVVLERAAADTHLGSDEQRCAFYRELVQRSNRLGSEAYAKLAGGRCPAPTEPPHS